jgi:hypothetical protein
MGKAYIIVALLVTALLVFGACTPEPEPEPTPVPPPEISITAPKLRSPNNGATDVQLKPTFLWELVPDAGGYQVTISLNYDFSTTIHDAATQLTAYQISQELTPSTSYYWMVCAKLDPADPDTPTACSEVWAFTTAEEPEPTTPLEPPPLPEPPPPSAEPVKITAAQLSTEYDEIGLVAETQYKYQTLEVSGTFDSFGISYGAPYIDFEVASNAWEIRAFLAKDQASKAETLAKGDEITLIGSCQGTGSYLRIVLADCRITVP